MNRLPSFTATLPVTFGIVCMGFSTLHGQKAKSPPAAPKSAAGKTSKALKSTAPASGKQPSGAANRTKPKAADAKKQDAAAKVVLKRARDKLIGYKSVRARIVENVVLGGRRFKASGSYLQGTDLRLKLEFYVRVGTSKSATEGALLQVCDGDVLWTRFKVGDQVRITRRNVRKILKEAKAGNNLTRNLLVVELGLGGLPALLASIEKVNLFDKVETRQIDGKPFTVLSGSWIGKYRNQLAVGSRDGKQLPAHVPDALRIYFDRDDFPRRIVFRKTQTGSSVSRPMVTLDFDKIVLNKKVDDSEFEFVPPKDVVPIDVTGLYLKRLTPAKPSGGKPSGNAPPK